MNAKLMLLVCMVGLLAGCGESQPVKKLPHGATTNNSEWLILEPGTYRLPIKAPYSGSVVVSKEGHVNFRYSDAKGEHDYLSAVCAEEFTEVAYKTATNLTYYWEHVFFRDVTNCAVFTGYRSDKGDICIDDNDGDGLPDYSSATVGDLVILHDIHTSFTLSGKVERSEERPVYDDESNLKRGDILKFKADHSWSIPDVEVTFDFKAGTITKGGKSEKLINPQRTGDYLFDLVKASRYEIDNVMVVDGTTCSVMFSTYDGSEIKFEWHPKHVPSSIYRYEHETLDMELNSLKYYRNMRDTVILQQTLEDIIEFHFKKDGSD